MASMMLVAVGASLASPPLTSTRLTTLGVAGPEPLLDRLGQLAGVGARVA